MKKIWFTPAMLFHHDALVGMPVEYFDLNNRADDSLNACHQRMKPISGYTYDDTHAYLTGPQGEHFHFLVNQGVVKLWNSGGNRFVGEVKEPGATFSRETVHALYTLMAEYTQGQTYCAECHQPLLRADIAGTFYAGAYCQKCWEGGVREQAARENYD